MIRDLFEGMSVDTVFRRGYRPWDLRWNTQLDEPSVIQMSFCDTVRITWNPDDNRFYVEWKQVDDWVTQVTRACNGKGWDNAKYTARTLIGVDND